MTGHSAIAPPRSHARRVLLTVSGLSPQIITETLHALAVRPTSAADAFVPTEVHALTTTEGAERIRLALLTPQANGRPGGFHRLCQDHGLEGITFGDNQIHLVRDAAGQALSDIRSDADNALMADAITELVRQFTADPDSALHVSLAGGRKTMGYYAGYALSLFGREQDRLSHVLVSTPFESLPDFFYPTPQTEVLPLRDGGWVDASQAVLSLALIPFVRLRQGLPRALLDGRSGFAAAVAAATAGLGAPELRIDIASRRVWADGVALPLPPMQFGLFTALAQRAIDGKPALPAPLRDSHDATWADEVLADLRRAVGLMHMPDGVEDSLRRDCSGNKTSPHLSRLRKLLAERLAPGRDRLYFDDGNGQRPKRYRVPLDAAAIDLVLPDSPAASLPSRRQR